MAKSARMAPKAKITEPYARVAVAALTSCSEMASMLQEPTPGQAKIFSAKKPPAKMAGMVKAMLWATGIKETRSACREMAWFRVSPLARAVRTKSALTLSRR